jgi:hypothetical protein
MDFSNLTKVASTRKKEVVVAPPKINKQEPKTRYVFISFIINKDTDIDGRIVYTVNDSMYSREVLRCKAKKPVDTVFHEYISRCYGLGYCQFNFKLI